jgi:hypothetical protein
MVETMTTHRVTGEQALAPNVYWCMVDFWPEPGAPEAPGAWDSWEAPPPPRGASEFERIESVIVEDWGSPTRQADRMAWERAQLPRPSQGGGPWDRLVRVAGDRALVELVRWFHGAGGARTIAPLAAHAFLGDEFAETLLRWLERSPLPHDSFLVMVLHDADAVITIAHESSLRAIAGATS